MKFFKHQIPPIDSQCHVSFLVVQNFLHFLNACAKNKYSYLDFHLPLLHLVPKPWKEQKRVELFEKGCVEIIPVNLLLQQKGNKINFHKKFFFVLYDKKYHQSLVVYFLLIWRDVLIYSVCGQGALQSRTVLLNNHLHHSQVP